MSVRVLEVAESPAQMIADVAFDDALLGMEAYESRAQMVADFRREMAEAEAALELQDRKEACWQEGGTWNPLGWCFDDDPKGW